MGMTPLVRRQFSELSYFIRLLPFFSAKSSYSFPLTGVQGVSVTSFPTIIHWFSLKDTVIYYLV